MFSNQLTSRRDRVTWAIVTTLCLALVAWTAVGLTAEPVGAAPVATTTSTTETTATGLVMRTTRTGNTEVKTFGSGKPVIKVLSTPAMKSGVIVTLPPGDPGTAPTVYDMSLASGMTPDQACEFAEGMDPFGCSTTAEVAARGSAKVARLLAGKKFIGAKCYDHVTYRGDGHKTNHACVSRWLDGLTPKSRFIGNKMKATGWTTDPGWFRDRINGVGVQARYSASAAHAVDWDPYATVTLKEGCKSTTVSATSPRGGQSYSQSSTVCPHKMLPWHSPKFQYFGSKWKGPAAPAEETRGTIAASVHKQPRNATQKCSAR